MKGKCCGFKFLDKIFRDKAIYIYSIFSISMCAVVYKKQAGMQVQLSGIQQYDILNRSVARILSGCLFGD